MRTKYIIMKKSFAAILITFAFFTSCKKALEQPADWSSMAVIHASPVSTSTPTDTLHVFVDTMRYNSTGITYNTNSNYLPVLAGSRKIDIRRGANNASLNYVSSFTYTFERAQAYSFFVYDTTTSNTGTAKVLRLKDDLTLPTGTNTQVRFLHLAPKGGAVDVTLLRTSATPKDSITITNSSYVGADPNMDALSKFTSIPGGTYTAKVKLAGTQTVTLISDIALNSGRIVTIYITGTAKGRPLAVGSFRHY